MSIIKLPIFFKRIAKKNRMNYSQKVKTKKERRPLFSPRKQVIANASGKSLNTVKQYFRDYPEIEKSIEELYNEINAIYTPKVVNLLNMGRERKVKSYSKVGRGLTNRSSDN